MKYIKSRNKFLNEEAKIKDVIFKRQADAIKSLWGEKFLDYEEVDPTEKIKQGRWKLDEDDKNSVFSAFFDADLRNLTEIFSLLPDKFVHLVSKSIDIGLLDDEKYTQVLKNFDIRKPSIDQIINMYNNIFRKLSTGETMATEMVSKGEDGRPIRDENNNIVKISKEAGDPIFSKNFVNINVFVDDYNKCFPESSIHSNAFNNSDIRSIRDLAMNVENKEYDIDFAIFDKDIYLSISHNPKDILNMSISKFYSSCQHLYGGGYREQLLGNVFDPNSIPAFLTFETPIFWDKEKISDQLPLSRMIIRNLESFESDNNNVVPNIFFDRAYPDRVKDVFDRIVKKYSGNVNTVNKKNSSEYLFTPDADSDDIDKLGQPYMDTLSVIRGTYIGINTKTLYLSRIDNWKSFKISKNSKIKELIIETTDLPENIFDLVLNLDWIKFKLLKIKTIGNFDKLKANSIAFDKCSFDGSILKTLKEFNPNLKRLQLTACNIQNLDLSIIGSLDELQLIYTLKKEENLSVILEGVNIKKLVISGDVVSKRENKIYLNSLKSKGVKIEIIGPVI